MDTAQLLRLLQAIQSEGAILQAAKNLNISYRNAWGLLREAEAIFGAPLLKKQRGRGATLTSLATTLLWADRRITARLSPTLESLSSELENQLGKSISSDSDNAVRLCASHGFAVATLMEHLNRAAFPIELRYLSSMESIAALSKKECELAGFHVPVGIFESEVLPLYLEHLCPKQHCLIHLANLKQGLLVASGNPKKINGLTDLTRKDIRFVNRQTGSSTRRLLEALLKEQNIAPHQINGFETAEFTHSAIAAYIASNMANVGFGIETAARLFGLDFVPLMEERYFFAAHQNALQHAPLSSVIHIMQSTDFKQQVNLLSGYNASETGSILSLEEAFGSALFAQ